MSETTAARVLTLRTICSLTLANRLRSREILMSKYVVMSDLHFGDASCSLRLEPVCRGLRDFLEGLGKIDGLVLAGDILDANISSLSSAIYGSEREQESEEWPAQPGFKRWLDHLFENGLDVEKITYVPGNHDYKVWDLLSTHRAFVEPLSRGVRPQGLPLLEGVFPDKDIKGSEPFIRGVVPEGMRERFEVCYPDFEFSMGGKDVLVTHGHYLDEKQTLFKNLRKLIADEDGIKTAVIEFFKYTAQYQAVANAVSFTRNWRANVDWLHKNISGIFAAIDIAGKLRGTRIDNGTLEAIEAYLHYFRGRTPQVFIFGHTHEHGRSNTGEIDREYRIIKNDIEVWNTGSFMKNGSRAGSFIVADDDGINIYTVSTAGNVAEA